MNNQVILQESSKIEIKITDKQWEFLLDKLEKMTYLEAKLKHAKLDIEANILTLSLLEHEGVDSSKIEGTQTNHEQMYFNVVDGINDKYSWEVRNLINLYKSTFSNFKDGIIDYEIDDLKMMHRDLYIRQIKDFHNVFDPIKIIQSIKPGKLIIDDEKPNWIGTHSLGIENASLIPINPSDKERYLEDLFQEIRNNKGKKNMKILIKFHPIFEGIHPFADGNGRLGRLLLTNLFSYLGFCKYNWIFMSNYWNAHKAEYMNELLKVQTTGNWSDWVYYFVGVLNHVVNNAYQKLNAILDLYLNKKNSIKMNVWNQKILNYFFKYPILNKQQTIEHLITKYQVSSATAYRAFDKIAKHLNVSLQKSKNYLFQEMWDIIIEK